MDKALQTQNIRGWPWDKEKLALTDTVTWSSGKPVNKEWVSPDGKVTIKENGDFVILKTLKWDNATGVPSGRCLTKEEWNEVPVKSLTDDCVTILWKATLIHDICCKYACSGLHFPYSRGDGDHFFLKLCKEAGFNKTKLYYRAVRLFGKIITFFKK